MVRNKDGWHWYWLQPHAAQRCGGGSPLTPATPVGCRASTAVTTRRTHCQAAASRHPHHRTVLHHHIARVASGSWWHSCGLYGSTDCLPLTSAVFSQKGQDDNIKPYNVDGRITDGRRIIKQSWLQRYSFWLAFERCQVQMSVGTKTTTTEVLLLFTLCKQIPSQYLKIHDCSLPHPSQFITRC